MSIARWCIICGRGWSQLHHQPSRGEKFDQPRPHVGVVSKASRSCSRPTLLTAAIANRSDRVVALVDDRTVTDGSPDR
jgi:hypothetical protein